MDQINNCDLSSMIQIPDWGDAISKLTNRIHSDLDLVKKDIKLKQTTIDCKEINERLNLRLSKIEAKNEEMIESIIKIQNTDNNSIKSDNIEYYEGEDINNIDQNELEKLVSQKVQGKKENLIKIQEGNLEEIEYQNSEKRSNDNNVVKMSPEENKYYAHEK